MPLWAEWSAFGLTILGFAITIWQVRQAKSAAEQAKDAALRARDAAIRAVTTDDLLHCIGRLDDLKTLHRAGVWTVALDRYGGIHRSLGIIRVLHPDLSDDHKAAIQRVMRQIQELERKVEAAFRSQAPLSDSDAFNTKVTKLIETLTEVHAKIRKGATEV